MGQQKRRGKNALSDAERAKLRARGKAREAEKNRPLEQLAGLKDKLKAEREAEQKMLKAREQAEAREAQKVARAEAEARFERAKIEGANVRTLKKSDDLSSYTSDDQVAFHQAFAGVESLDKKRVHQSRGPSRERVAAQVTRRAQEAEEEARTRLGQLVGGGVRFVVRREGQYVEGRRHDTPERTCVLLANGELAPTAHLDLHGMTQKEAASRVRAFIRDKGSSRKSAAVVSIIHGKGKGSSGGQGVLQGVVIAALTKGGAAPFVDAFATAPRRMGGDGALLVRLRRQK